MSISAKERKEIPNREMGVPSKDKYPLDSPEHIKSAAHLINHGHITSDEKKTLANKILRRAREEGVSTDGMHAVKQIAKVSEQVPPMSDGTSLGNAPPRLMAPYYDEQDEMFSQLDKMDTRKFILSPIEGKRIVSEIHNKVESDSKPPTGNQNCQLCTWCAEAQCRGMKVLPRPVYSPRDPALEIKGEMIVEHPYRNAVTSFENLMHIVSDENAAYSRFYVHVGWKGGTGGHEFLIVGLNVPFIMDAQQGYFESMANPKVLTDYFNDVDWSNSYICRLDDKPINSALLNSMNNMNKLVPWDPKLDIPYMKEHGMLSDADMAEAEKRGWLTESFMDEYQQNANDKFRRVLVPSDEGTKYLKEDPECKQYWEDINKGSHGEFLIDTKNNKPIGHVFVHTNKKNKGFIYNLEVSPEYRRQGYGMILTDDAVRRFGGEDLTVDADNKPAIKMYLKYGFEIYKKGQWHYDPPKDELWMKIDKNKLPKPIQEAAYDNTLIPVNDYKYNKVYYGDPTNGGSIRKLGDKPLFVTPRAALATIFLGRRELFHELSRRGYPKVNLGYDEWNDYESLPPDKPLMDVHVYVRNQPDLEPFTIKYEGYLHTIDCSGLKNNIYRYKWMSEPDQEVLIANVPDVKIDDVRKLGITYHVRGIQGKEPDKPIQEGSTMDFKDDELLSVLKNSKYGVAYHDKLITNPSEQDYMNKWHCLSPNEFINVGGGVCYDFVEWESDYLKKHQIPFKKFHISHHIGFDKVDVGKDAATHSICIAVVNGKYMYIEGSSKKLAKEMGYIKEFNNIDELLDFAVKHTIHDPEQSKLIIIDYTNVDNLIGLNLFDYQNRIFSKGKVITSDFIQEGTFQDLKNGVNPYSDKMVFHVTPEKHADGQIWKPRVPDYLDPYNPEETGFEDNTTPRICFSTSIEGCLNGITVNLPRQNPDQFDKMYVYIPEKPWKEYKHKTNKELVKEKLVYDANVTREVWITEPVRMKLYGVIRVDQVSNVKRKSVVPTSKGEKGDRNYFTYKWHWVVKPKVLEKGTKYDYSQENVIADLCIDLKKFKYGLIRDGKLQTGNVSESDYEKYWVFHSGQEVDEAGGGNCWDMVEYESGYLDAFGVPYKKYFMNFTKTDGKTPVNTHTFCVIPHNGKFIYIEQAFKRIIDEWGHERQKTFDSLKEIFQYIAEVSAEYNNQDLNYGVWDYTNAKIDYGTPANEFCNWIMSKCKMVYDGEAKKPTVKKEGYRVSRFGNLFQEADEKLSETEDITIGDLNLDDNDDIGEDGPGLPGYMEDRMSDDDLESYKSSDDDFEIPEEGDFESYKVSDEKLDVARGPIDRPQPDEEISVTDVDLGSFGKDTSDIQNEYDPKEVTILMKLMASEADAMNEYMDGAKETNVDVLRRLYADIANEERFHMEQLLYAKCELTGEKYVPKDPEVKSEYEELLKMGMDEETAMATAVDRCHIRGSIADDDTEERIEIQEDITQMESVLRMFDIMYDHTSMVLESKSATPEDVDRAMSVFTEACLMQEATYNATPAETEKSPLSKANKFGPLQLLRDTLRFLIRALMTIIRKFVEFIKRIHNRSREIRRFVKQYGIKGLVSDKVRMYFIDLKQPESMYINNDVWFLLSLAVDTTNACAAVLRRQGLSGFTDVPKNPKLDIRNNISRGVELLNGVQLIKSPMVIPDDNDEQQRIAAALFGYTLDTSTNTKYYGDDGKSVNTLNTMKIICDRWVKFMQNVLSLSDSLSQLEQDKTSIYYTDRKKYDTAVKGLETVTKTCKAMISALQNDINVIIKLDNEAADISIKKTEAMDSIDIKSDARVQGRANAYEQNKRTQETSRNAPVADRFKR